MGILEQITQMKNQRIPEDEIVNRLQEQGISPKAINDALGQSKIKEAVSTSAEDMEPSIMEGEETPQQSLQAPAPYPKTQEVEAYEEEREDLYTPQPQPQTPAEPQTSPYAQEFYPQEGYDEYYAGGGFDTDTMIEIAGQVFSEKIRKIQKQLEEMGEFKTLAETKIEFTLRRLERIEATIDKLQSAILEKIGSYGRGLESIKKEMSMMQDSFSKMVPSLAAKHAPHKVTHHTPHKTIHKKTTSKKTTVKKKTISKK